MSKHWFVAHLISKYSKNKSLGLDIGAGLDNWKEYKHCKFVNIDKNPPNQVIDIEKEDLPFANNSFPFIISINVLNLLGNYRIATEIKRVLASGGIFVCVVNNENAIEQGMTSNKLISLFQRGFKPKMNIIERLFAWHYNR